jgi:hypothetical protein
MNKRALALILAVWAGSSSLEAAVPSVVLQSLKGKVEVKLPGTTEWVAATEGQILGLSATLSTGFDSSVVVVLGKTTLQVKPLTRMSIDKLAEEGGTLKTTTFLRVGSVAASVKSAEGIKQEFKVQSPYSTASVRGTEFTYDGLHLAVKEGVVAFIPGRPQREIPSPDSRGNTDFVGAPDVPADPSKAVPVAAGKDAKLVVDFQGAPPKTSSSQDLDSLQKSSGQVQNLPQAPTIPKATSTTGSVQLTIVIGS